MDPNTGFLINNLNDSKFIITNGYSDNWGTPFNKKFIILDPYINKLFVCEKN